MVIGDKLVLYCLIEFGVGFDVVLFKIKVMKVDGGYVFNGFKVFIFGVGSMDVFVVMVCIGEDGFKGVFVFVVLVNVDGIEYGKVEEKMGWNV